MLTCQDLPPIHAGPVSLLRSFGAPVLSRFRPLILSRLVQSGVVDEGLSEPVLCKSGLRLPGFLEPTLWQLVFDFGRD